MSTRSASFVSGSTPPGDCSSLVVLLWDDGEVEIIHAMKARAQYRRLLP